MIPEGYQGCVGIFDFIEQLNIIKENGHIRVLMDHDNMKMVESLRTGVITTWTLFENIGMFCLKTQTAQSF